MAEEIKEGIKKIRNLKRWLRQNLKFLNICKIKKACIIITYLTEVCLFNLKSEKREREGFIKIACWRWSQPPPTAAVSSPPSPHMHITWA